MSQTNGGKSLTLRATLGSSHSVLIPNTLYVALMGTAPAATDSGDDLDEPTTTEYPAYRRVAVANTDALWTISGDAAQNASIIVFPSSAASGGTIPVQYFALCTGPSVTGPSAGEVLVWGQLPSPKTIGAASVLPRFLAGTLRVSSADPQVV